MAIIVTDVSNVIIDGTNAGQVGDAIRNHAARGSEIQVALVAWQTAEQQKHADALTALTTAHAAATAAATAQHADTAAKLATADDLIVVLGGTEVGQRMAKEKRLADALVAKEAADKALADLQKVK